MSITKMISRSRIKNMKNRKTKSNMNNMKKKEKNKLNSKKIFIKNSTSKYKNRINSTMKIMLKLMLRLITMKSINNKNIMLRMSKLLKWNVKLIKIKEIILTQCYLLMSI